MISWAEADLLIKKLMAESIPVIAFFVSADGAHMKLPGFVDSKSLDWGLVVAESKGSPSAGPYLRVPILSDCTFSFGDKRELAVSVREDLAAKYGDTVLMMTLPSGSVLSLLFNL